MKKFVLAVTLFASACAFAKEATLVTEKPAYCTGCMKEWTPFALTLAGPVGLPWGAWNVYGCQIGLWNSVYEFSGLQLGVVNIASRAYGVQIGLVNVIESNDIPFLPIVNWNF